MNPPPLRSRSRTDDTLGTGIEAGVVLVIFAGVGYGLDSWLGTRPILLIVLFFVGAVGLFARFKASYTLHIEELARERKSASTPRRGER